MATALPLTFQKARFHAADDSVVRPHRPVCSCREGKSWREFRTCHEGDVLGSQLRVAKFIARETRG